MNHDPEPPEQCAADENVLTSLEQSIFCSDEDRRHFARAKQLVLQGVENAQVYREYEVKAQHLRHYAGSQVVLLKFLQRDENAFSREHLSDIFLAYYAMRFPERVERRAPL